ncbi:hypothetical protein AKJ09_07653 [Labilithrix luteola]|uniref:PEGA domain-containing protein n=1 Tax=Labilithrix luteola TaxID=1391654 RepID=A0A0K1Q6E6_9BACT|nr:hypothetical protein [Labilithrix luteola]AKV00990.1 hypothetical protein AKJ09_07653 [Labilithrix luteola]
MNGRRIAAAIALLGLVVSGRSAHAQEDATSVAAARTIGLEGLRLAESGNCREAIEKLERAEKLHHAPTTLAKLGECHVQIGKLVLGTEELARLVREPLAADAPPAFVSAKARAQKLLEETRPRLAQLHIKVVGPASPQVTVDGETVPAALLDIDRPTDPGAHTVEATAPGFKSASSPVSLKEGERVPVTLTLEVDPNAHVVVDANTSRSGATQPKESDAKKSEGGSGMRVVGWTLLGVGAAGLVTGGVAALLASGTKSDLDNACTADGACPRDQESAISRLKTESTISTIGLIVGGVGVVGGVTILLASPSNSGSARVGNAAAPKPVARAPKAPFLSVGPSSVALRGEF